MLNIIHDIIVLKGSLLEGRESNEDPTYEWDEEPHKRAAKN